MIQQSRKWEEDVINPIILFLLIKTKNNFYFFNTYKFLCDEIYLLLLKNARNFFFSQNLFKKVELRSCSVESLTKGLTIKFIFLRENCCFF